MYYDIIDSCKFGRLKHIFVGPYAERLFMVVKILRLPSRICNIFRGLAREKLDTSFVMDLQFLILRGKTHDIAIFK